MRADWALPSSLHLLQCLDIVLLSDKPKGIYLYRTPKLTRPCAPNHDAPNALCLRYRYAAPTAPTHKTTDIATVPPSRHDS
jgi:hypothetical protein